MEKKTDNELTQFDEKTVTVANILVRSKMVASKEQYDLFMLIISQLNPYQKNDPTVVIYKEDLFKKLGLKSRDRYSRTKKTIKEMSKNTWLEINEKTKNDVQDIAGFLIVGMESTYKSDHFLIKMNPDFLPFMQQLKAFYVTFELDSILKFSSSFSQRLYTYICSWKDIGEVALTTEELKDIFGLTNDDYIRKDGKFDRYTFEARTVDIAAKEISELTSLRITYKKTRRGNRIKEYVFTWTEKEELPNQITITETAEVSTFKIDWNLFFHNPNCNQDHVHAVQDVYNQVMRAKEDRTFPINQDRVPAEEVQIEFKKLDNLMIEQVLTDLAEAKKIDNVASWLYTVLYYAPINSKIKMTKTIEKEFSIPDRDQIELGDFAK